jgi:hypothetical protein
MDSSKNRAFAERKRGWDIKSGVLFPVLIIMSPILWEVSIGKRAHKLKSICCSGPKERLRYLILQII